jgi:putative transcriptional regulator
MLFRGRYRFDGGVGWRGWLSAARSEGGSHSSRTLSALAAIGGILMMAVVLAGVGPGGAAAPVQNDGSLKGRLLVATSEMTDPRFVRTVIFMIQHDATGAMGLVINRPIGRISIAALLEQLGAGSSGVGGDLRVHYGGPVEPMQGFVLHTSDYTTPDTHVVRSGIALTTDTEVLRAIGAGSGPRRSLFALGYAGWAPGQLEGEIERGHWVDVQADEKIVFDENADKKWERALARRVIVL